MAQQLSNIGLVGLAVMGQNLALNIAEKGFSISVYNRTTSKVDETVELANKEGNGNWKLFGYHTVESFVASLERPRKIIILVKAGGPVDQTIAQLVKYLEAGDIIIDGGNEWYINTQRRAQEVAAKGILYMGMGVSGGEEGARHGPSLMPGGPLEAYQAIEPIASKIAAQVDDGPCVTYIGTGGAGNYVKMIHNGIEYGDMQLIAEVYHILKDIAKLTNEELAQVFDEWNNSELKSFLIEITANIFKKRDDLGEGFLVDKIVDVAGSKGTGKWTIQEAAERAVAAPTIAGSLDSRYLSGLKDERVAASEILRSEVTVQSGSAPIDKAQIIADARAALYCAKICSYTQGFNILKTASAEFNWGLNLGAISRIWKGGCIIRAIFLDRIKAAYDRNSGLASLLVDPAFAAEIREREQSWRRLVQLCVSYGIPSPCLAGSLFYYDSYRCSRLPANLIQAQRDYFGAHTYERTDQAKGQAFHTQWTPPYYSKM